LTKIYLEDGGSKKLTHQSILGRWQTYWWCAVACVTLVQWEAVLGRVRGRAASIGRERGKSENFNLIEF
jgi:hypothetical protein